MKRNTIFALTEQKMCIVLAAIHSIDPAFSSGSMSAANQKKHLEGLITNDELLEKALAAARAVVQTEPKVTKAMELLLDPAEVRQQGIDDVHERILKQVDEAKVAMDSASCMCAKDSQHKANCGCTKKGHAFALWVMGGRALRLVCAHAEAHAAVLRKRKNASTGTAASRRARFPLPKLPGCGKVVFCPGTAFGHYAEQLIEHFRVGAVECTSCHASLHPRLQKTAPITCAWHHAYLRYNVMVLTAEIAEGHYWRLGYGRLAQTSNEQLNADSQRYLPYTCEYHIVTYTRQDLIGALQNFRRKVAPALDECDLDEHDSDCPYPRGRDHLVEINGAIGLPLSKPQRRWRAKLLKRRDDFNAKRAGDPDRHSASYQNMVKRQVTKK